MTTVDRHTVAVIGGGSAAEALVRELDGAHDIVIFEPELVGGECPFLACMPSKSMLHDRSRRDWSGAVDRREVIVSGRDDSAHADTNRDLGATIVRARATVTGPNSVDADGISYEVDHIVVATGAAAIFPDIDGLDPDHDRVWTSEDVLVAVEQPASVVVLGGGVIGSELAFMLAGFGTTSTTLDASERPAADLHPRVGELISDTLRAAGVDVVNGIEVERVEATAIDVTVHLADGATHTADRLIVAIGREPRQRGIGLECLGVDPGDLTIDSTGRLLDTEASVWFIGDAAGVEQYTHMANKHAAVVANHLVGDRSRAFDDSVVPACIFIDPPVMVVGPTCADLAGDDDVVWAGIELDTPRSMTDEHGDGFLAVAARRSTGCVVAANGIGARFDEIVHALVIAIDGQVPVSRLVQTIQPFPTVGEILGQVFAELHGQLSAGS